MGIIAFRPLSFLYEGFMTSGNDKKDTDREFIK